MKRKELSKVIEAIKHIRDGATDDVAYESLYAYQEWKVGTDYKKDDRVRYEDNLYKCVQAHTSQSDWTPNVVPALWVKISVEAYPNWTQPTGSHDAYQVGDKVTYNGEHYKCLVGNNVWAPNVYGWERE